MTVPQAAAHTGRSQETIRRWIRAGKLRARKIGTQHMIEEEDLDALYADEVLPIPESWGWDRRMDGGPMPNVVKVIRESRQGR